MKDLGSGPSLKLPMFGNYSVRKTRKSTHGLGLLDGGHCWNWGQMLQEEDNFSWTDSDFAVHNIVICHVPEF